MTCSNSKKIQDVTEVLKDANVRTEVTSGTKIADLVRDRRVRENSIVYMMPYASCDNSYIGESKRGLDTRLRKHKAVLRHHSFTSDILGHVDEAGHLPC